MAYNPAVQSTQVLRASGTAIGTSYDAAPVELRIQNQNRVALYCNLNLNTATDVLIQVDVATPANGPGLANEPAPVAADWYPLSETNISGLTVGGTPVTITAPYGQLTIQLTQTGKYAIVLDDVFGKYMRVRAKTTGGPGTTTLSIIGVQGLA